jgi:hypothetical protein
VNRLSKNYTELSRKLRNAHRLEQVLSAALTCAQLHPACRAPRRFLGSRSKRQRKEAPFSGSVSLPFHVEFPLIRVVKVTKLGLALLLAAFSYKDLGNSDMQIRNHLSDESGRCFLKPITIALSRLGGSSWAFCHCVIDPCKYLLYKLGRLVETAADLG